MQWKVEPWQEGSTVIAMPLTSASHIVGQHNKKGGIPLRASHIYIIQSPKNTVYNLLKA